MIRTPRLVLRDWRAEDAVAHNALRADPRIAATLGAPVSLEESRDTVARQQAWAATLGHCFWVVEHDGAFGGWCGIKPGKPPIEGETEIGWTLAPALWGRGLATEAARAVLDWTWANTGAPAVAAITAAVNARSQAVMARLGMMRIEGGDFAHPDLAADDPLSTHVRFRIGRPA